MLFPKHWQILTVILELDMSYYFHFSTGKAKTERNIEISKIMSVSHPDTCVSEEGIRSRQGNSWQPVLRDISRSLFLTDFMIPLSQCCNSNSSQQAGESAGKVVS